MRTFIGIGIACLLSSSLPGVASAGPASEELSKCLVRSVSEADKTVLVQWIFSTFALHPKVGDLAVVSEERRAQVVKETAALIQDLLTKACREESKRTYQGDGFKAIGQAFTVLGQLAGQGIAAHPAVAEGMRSFASYVDEAAVKRALME